MAGSSPTYSPSEFLALLLVAVFAEGGSRGGSVLMVNWAVTGEGDPKGSLGIGKLMGGLGGNMLLVHGEGNTFADFEFWKHLGVQNNAILFECRADLDKVVGGVELALADDFFGESLALLDHLAI